MSLDSVAAYSEQPEAVGYQGDGIEPVNPDLDETDSTGAERGTATPVDDGETVSTDENE